jgi:hypothetical protein
MPRERQYMRSKADREGSAVGEVAIKDPAESSQVQFYCLYFLVCEASSELWY